MKLGNILELLEQNALRGCIEEQAMNFRRVHTKHEFLKSQIFRQRSQWLTNQTSYALGPGFKSWPEMLSNFENM